MKYLYRIIPAVFCFIMITSSGFSQHTKTVSFTKHLKKGAKPYVVKTNYPTTGITVCISSIDTFSEAWLLANSDTLRLTSDEHNSENAKQQFSNLLTVSQAIEEFIFYPGQIKGEVTFTYIDARMPEDAPPPRVMKKKSAGCSEPEMIDQSEWRVGLTDPDYDRIPCPVNNMIVHHSAGSNTDNNYSQVVRNIYIYHTETRGWDDIGYNYLIAQDGTIYKGRDPDTLQQDSVQGAHFCASNYGTLGICILGNYIEIVPPDTTLASLVKLLNWKAEKTGLDPQGQYPHALSATLPVIAGHRDGCPTECPGEKLYLLLQNIRLATFDASTDCSIHVNSINHIELPENTLQISGSNNEIHISYIEPFYASFITLMGIPLKHQNIYQSDSEMRYLLDEAIKGLVVVCVHAGNKTVSRLIYLP